MLWLWAALFIWFFISFSWREAAVSGRFILASLQALPFALPVGSLAPFLPASFSTRDLFTCFFSALVPRSYLLQRVVDYEYGVCTNTEKRREEKKEKKTKDKTYSPLPAHCFLTSLLLFLFLILKSWSYVFFSRRSRPRAKQYPHTFTCVLFNSFSFSSSSSRIFNRIGWTNFKLFCFSSRWTGDRRNSLDLLNCFSYDEHCTLYVVVMR